MPSNSAYASCSVIAIVELKKAAIFDARSTERGGSFAEWSAAQVHDMSFTMRAEGQSLTSFVAHSARQYE